MKKIKCKSIAAILLAISVIIAPLPETFSHAEMDYIPSYDGDKYVYINDGEPEFTEEEKECTESFETYSELDNLGRCGVAYANLCEELMPDEERGDISSIHPTGWKTGVGYNRCHLIGFQLAGENANERNLITGTSYFNVSGMLPFENMVADYIEETGNHVLYRVTPVFKGNELVARGVQIEAWSVEDCGEICFNVYCFNVFKGNNPKINYSTGAVTTVKSTQKITVGKTYKSYTVSKKLASKHSFSMKVSTSSGNKSCTKKSGSKYLSVSKKGTVYVKKGTPVGKYTMKVKIYAKSTSKYKSRTITKTVTVKVKKKATSKVYWTPSGSCYHKTKSCRSLARSKTIYSGSLSTAKSKGLNPCKNCYH